MSYGITVEKHVDYDWELDDPKVVTDLWDVYLPHSCDAWEIVSMADHESAMKQLKDFILEASQALAYLARKEEFNAPDY